MTTLVLRANMLARIGVALIFGAIAVSAAGLISGADAACTVGVGVAATYVLLYAHAWLRFDEAARAEGRNAIHQEAARR
jgi:hypothetical protein